jgi:opacity protein-like surface antigen
MRSFVMLTVGMLALAGVADAQSAAPAPDHGYIEGVAQSAFGNVTSQSYGVELGFTVLQNLQVFVEAGQTRNVATAAFSAAAQTMAGALSQTQSNVGFSAKEPVILGAAGLRFLIPIEGSKAQPYVMGGFGLAKVTQDAKFSVGGTDVTSSLQQPPYYITLGTDVSGDFTKPMFTLGGGVAYPVWKQLQLDLQFRFGRIFAEDEAINVTRVGIGIGVRF